MAFIFSIAFLDSCLYSMFWALHSPVRIVVYAKMHRRLLAFCHPLNVIRVSIERFSYLYNVGNR